MSNIIIKYSFFAISFCFLYTVQQVLALMVDLEEDPEWSLQDIEEDDDTDS